MSITNGYATLAEIRAWVGITSVSDTTDDTALEKCVEAASRLIDNETGRTFYARTETHYYDTPENARTLEIKDDDLLTVTTLTNGDGTTIAGTEYILYPRNCTPKYSIVIKATSSAYFTCDTAGGTEGAITVLGTWGFCSTTPSLINRACLIQAARLFKRRDAVFGVAGSNAVGEAVMVWKLDPDVYNSIATYRVRV